MHKEKMLGETRAITAVTVLATDTAQRGGMTLAQAMLSILASVAIVVAVVSSHGFALQHGATTDPRVVAGFAAHNAMYDALAATMYDADSRVRSGMSASATWTAPPAAAAPAASAAATAAPVANLSATWANGRVYVNATVGRQVAPMSALLQPVALPPGTTIDTTQ